jgi:DNA-binding NarL/FixJ family response regulator
MVTMLEDDRSIFSAMRAGARGYVLKGAEPNELLQSIRAVANGQVLFGPSVAARMMRFFDEQVVEIKTSLPEEAFPELTPRELEVLELIAQGDKNNEIAEKFVISEKTVRNHVTNIFSKLQVVDRVEAIIKAREAGMADN